MTLRGQHLVILGIALTVSTVAGARMLPRDTEESFRKLIRLTESGGAGADIINANVSILQESARIELVFRDGKRESFVARYPQMTGQQQSQYFAIEPVQGASPEHAALLGRLLDQCFTSDPFAVQPEGEAADLGLPVVPSAREAWARNGWRGAVSALTAGSLLPVSRGYAATAMAIHVVALFACMLLLWRGRTPDRD